ncbi:TIGR02281 family clan AA aspartic protease [Parvularcula dongshanensis]|uniref:Aspartyl protease family protein n=1 Tax=Parvularcula dongshanensis TaxID=1173995 RepID=A0A840I1M7_9PROT|nr:aspartyl protease family protein [Parvularcula dongshanensis]
MRERAGFYAVATLAVVLLFLAMRGFDSRGHWNPAREVEPARFETVDGEQRIVLRAGPSGHFFFQAEANGAPVRFMVDTGASYVTLTESDAERAGLRFSPEDFTLRFETANGAVYAAGGTLDELRIGDAVIRTLAVVVVPDDKLGGSLFGVNGLNRFDRRETTRDELVLTVEAAPQG